jgi:hypothetical protein
MNVLTKDDAAEKLNVETLDSCVTELLQRLPSAGAAYSVPPQSRAQTALAKFLAYLLLERSGVYVYLSHWSLHPASEQLDLFYGYRRSVGETRPLSEAPVHFIGANARHELESILCLIFFFGWEAWLFDDSGTMLVRVTHDGKLAVRAQGKTNLGSFAADPAKFFAPLASS